MIQDYSGFGFPQLLQKLPSLEAPQLGQIHLLETGLGSPQLLQKLPVLSAPHFGHFHASGAVAGLAADWAAAF